MISTRVHDAARPLLLATGSVEELPRAALLAAARGYTYKKEGTFYEFCNNSYQSRLRRSAAHGVADQLSCRVHGSLGPSLAQRWNNR